jgi:UDP-N-acetylmuramoyl-L-alanyl-D-glutamate--2,6-diaminopimelate ligase
VKLSELIKTIPILRITGDRGAFPEIGSIHYRAQDVEPGGLFVAISGHTADGHDFIDQALARGAVAIIVERPVEKDAVIISVENSRKALSAVAASFYGNPSQKLFVVGITGTNGKTTTAYLAESILRSAGLSVGVIGTVNYRYNGKTFDNPVTTPESSDLQRILADMMAAGATHAILEVSSHAMDLHRIADCFPDVGVFTNLSQDHLDFHGTMDAYWQSKKRLFTEHLSKKPKSSAVINGSDEKGRELLKKITHPTLSYGQNAENDIYPADIRQDLNGIGATVRTPYGGFRFRSPLVGRHNLENILGAIGIGQTLAIDTEAIQAGIEAVRTVPGRLERIPNRIDRYLFVDYAHTPDALENVLTALRTVTKDRIICIFGCGGDRDRKKRPQMGEIVGKLADLAVITSDNPRTESPSAIIDQIRPGVVRSSPRVYTRDDLRQGFKSKGYVVEADRKRAIELGIFTSRPKDTILIAGKGHETYQIIGKETLAFDDRLEAEKAMARYIDRRGRGDAMGDCAAAP